MALFFRSKSRNPEAADASRRLGAWTREILTLPEEATVSITEIACGEPGCGGVETMVLVMRPGEKTAGAKVKMGLALVSRDDLDAALADLKR